MLDASYPGHLPRKQVEVLAEGDKVPATVYLAKEIDPEAVVAEAYEQGVLELVRRLGDPILASFLEFTASPDGSLRYQESPPEEKAADTAPDGASAG